MHHREGLAVGMSLVLMGGATLSKSLIQFSVDGRGCVPSLLFGLRPSKGLMPALLYSVPTVPQAAVDPLLHPRLLDTHRQVWISFFLLAPGAHRVLCVCVCLCPLRVCFPSPVEVL